MQIGYMFRVNPAVQFCWKTVREGWLGDVNFIEADMNHCYGDDSYQRYVGTFKGGILYNLGCHLIDMIEPMTKGMPVDVHTVVGTAAGDTPDCLNRTAAMLDYPTMNVLVRSCSRAGGGNICRRLRIDGSNGTIDLCPIERFDGKELKMLLSLKGEEPREMAFGVQTDRYAAQLLDLAEIVRGEKANDQDYDRDLKVHEILIETISSCCKRKADK